MTAVLEVSGLVAGYGAVRVVHGIDLTVSPGEVVALLGPNGAGKTTTLLTISGLLRPLGGSLTLFGEPTGKRSASVIARSGVAHVPEDRSLFTQLTVAENIRMACRGAGRRAREEEVLGYFPELARIRLRKAGLLSGGEQQMLAVGRALASSPRLLLVDEMSLGLAPVIVRRLLPILRTIAREGGIGVLFVEQHVQFALELADRAYLMNRGRIALSGTGAELRTRKDLVQASYLGVGMTGPARVAELIDGIRAHRAEFEAAGTLAEEMRTLPPAAVSLLRSLGLFWLKTPAEFGGTPLTPLEFCDVLEELAFIDVSTAWATMIGNGCTGMAAGWLPDAGALRVFPGGSGGSGGSGGGAGGVGSLPLIAGQPQPRGVGRPVPGGYLVSGRWSFSSGIVHAGWVIGGFPVPDGPAGCRVFVAPKEEAEVIDTWHVAGLQGTGSLDYRLSDVFVPASMTYLRGGRAFRGGALFRQPGHLFVDNEVPPLTVGLARRALSDIASLAGQTARFPGGATLRERSAFHQELGRAWSRIRAARAVHREAISSAWAVTLTGADVPARLLTNAATASVYTVETCAEVVADLFRYGGGRALSLSSALQRHLRDALAARQHVSVSEEHYETAGRELLQSRKAVESLE